MLELLSFGPAGWGSQLAEGAWLTLRLALATLPVGMAIGLLLALAVLYAPKPLAILATGVTTTFRGLPELLTLFIIYYGAQFAIQGVIKLFRDGEPVEINGFVAGMVALGLVFGSFASEIFIAAIRAVPKGQFEAADAIGLSKRPAWLGVILPQVFRLALPGLGNLWFVLLKDTALVSAIALPDLMRQTTLAVASTKEPLFFYAIVCALYLSMSLVSSGVVRLLEQRAERPYTRGRL